MFSASLLAEDAYASNNSIEDGFTPVGFENPTVSDSEPPWTSMYVLQNFSNVACELDASVLYYAGEGMGFSGGGIGFEQVPTPSHPTPSLPNCETCVWQCVGKNIPRTCWEPENVCTTISVAVGGAAGAGCATGVARTGVGSGWAGAAGATCGQAVGSTTKRVCESILREKVCWDWNPCYKRDRVCTNNC